jgi:hypothetical protein
VKYMLLIYGSDEDWDAVPDADRQAMYEQYFALSRDLRDSGRYVDSYELQPASTATTVRVRDAQTLVTDGPFAETKERVGGYYLVQCESLDVALEIAARIPSARMGAVEVRPVVER